MDKQGQEYQWLEWAKELQFIAQAGLTYTKDLFDKERFERIREISAEIMKVCQNAHLLFFTHKAPTITSWGFVIT